MNDKIITTALESGSEFSIITLRLLYEALATMASLAAMIPDTKYRGVYVNPKQALTKSW